MSKAKPKPSKQPPTSLGTLLSSNPVTKQIKKRLGGKGGAMGLFSPPLPTFRSKKK